MQALILSGGMGTRLRTISGDLPKPLVPIAGKPVIEHQMDCLARSRVTEVIFVAGYRADLIEEHLRRNPRPFRTRVITETEPLGSAGAVLAGIEEFESRFFVVYGDTVFDIDFVRMQAFHEKCGADATLLVHPNDHPQDSDLVAAAEDGRIERFLGYPHPPGLVYRNLVNAGVYLLESTPLKRVAKQLPKKIDFAKNVFPALLGEKARLFAYSSREYIKDMGTPDRFVKVEGDLKSGKVERLALRNAVPAVFFDRDGTLTRTLEYVRTPEQLELLPLASQAVKRANKAGLLAVLATNQPVVARGECTLEGLAEIHRKLETELGTAHAYLDGIYFCPHHPDRGFPGEVAELKHACECRKPGPGMLRDADRDLHIDLKRSWLLGDTTTDLECARRAGVKSVLLRTGYAGRDGKFPLLPDYEFDDADQAARFIAEEYPSFREKAREWLAAQTLSPGAVITIGGPARSGKSTLGAVLQEALRDSGQPCERILLDGWLLPKKERKVGFRGRFDLSAIEATAKRLVEQRPAEIEIPVYDREVGGPFAWKAKTSVAPETILIFEGVITSLSPFLSEKAGIKLWADVSADLRRARFLEHYRARGYAEAQANQLFDEREAEEVSELNTLRARADWSWNGSEFRRIN